MASEHAHDSAHDQKDGEHSQDNTIDGAKDEVDDSQNLKRLIRFDQRRQRRGQDCANSSLAPAYQENALKDQQEQAEEAGLMHVKPHV